MERLLTEMHASPVRIMPTPTSPSALATGVDTLVFGALYFAPRLIPALPGKCASLPNRHFWPRPQRRPLAAEKLPHHLWRFGTAVFLFRLFARLKCTSYSGASSSAAAGLWRDVLAGRVARTGEPAAKAERAVRAQVARLVALEKDLFAAIGVDKRLRCVGKLPSFDAPNDYTRSAADMARFGVFGVSLPEDYPAKHGTEGGATIALIRLGQ